MLNGRLASKALVIVVATLACPSMVFAQGDVGCYGQWRFENANRHVFGQVTAECEPTPHSVPFGNWGVDSNLGSVSDTDQFAGWHDGEWNSCTYRYPPPSWTYYNYAMTSLGYTEQASSGIHAYGVQMDWWDFWFPCGHDELDGYIITVTNNYMSLRELDPWSSDEWVATAQYPDMNIVLDCDPAYSDCYTSGPWYSPTGVTPAILTGDIRMTILLQSQWHP